MSVVAKFLTPTYTNTFQTSQRSSGARVLTSEKCLVMLEQKQLKKEREKPKSKIKKANKKADKKKAEESARKAERRTRKRDEKQASNTQRKRSSTRTRVQEA